MAISIPIQRNRDGKVQKEESPTSRQGHEPAFGRFIFVLFLLHTAITMLSLGSRVPGLGALRPTLVLVGIIWIWWLLIGRRPGLPSGFSDPWGRRLVILIAFAIATLPFTMWPGSVLRAGLPTLIQAASFLFFCIFLCTTWQRLRAFVLVWVACQVFRVLHPVFLNLTTGYWGDAAHMGDGEFLNRLAGAPGDIVNPNGLGFIVASVLPFLHYVAMCQPRRILKLGYAGILGCLLFGVALTGSRSAIVALLIDVLLIAWRSRFRVLALSAIAIGIIASFQLMNADLVDRYRSLYSDSARNAKTREGRIAAMIQDFELGLERPIFGFGLGTSKEANWNMRHDRYIAHNMYAEILIELGLIGLIIFIMYLVSIVRCVSVCQHKLARAPPTFEGRAFLQALTLALQVWVPMALIFFFAQYGLREPDWYIVGGMAAALYGLLKDVPQSLTTAAKDRNKSAASSRGNSPLRQATSAQSRLKIK